MVRHSRVLRLPLSLLIPVLLAMALAPAFVAWRTGRAVLARADDPMLSELVFERSHRLTALTLGWAIGVAIVAAEHAVWVLLVLWLGLLVVAHPLRRVLYGEQLGALAFLRYSIISTVGHYGLGVFTAAAPALATTLAVVLAPDGSAAAIRIAAFAGVASAAIAALWRYNFTRVFLAAHRATPLRDSTRPELMVRIDATLDRAHPAPLKRPGVFRFGVPGAYVMTALYISSAACPAITFGDTLLASLTDDEIVGVFAHEVAHHEQLTPARCRRSRWSFAVLCVLVAGLPPLLIGTIPHAAIAVAWWMSLVILISTMRRNATRRVAETASDLRALALSGNVDALISGLTKLHDYSRVPRRWPHSLEQAATHPSLARRIQALREAAGRTPASPVTARFTVVRSVTEGVVIAFDGDRAYWFEGVSRDTPPELQVLRDAASSYRAAAYGDLTELRVSVVEAGRALEARDRDGRSWRVPIAPNDVAAIQAVLDMVDGKLGKPPSAVAAVGTTLTRWYALTILVTLLIAGELGVALVPILLVVFRPTLSAALAATAAIAIERVLLALRTVAWTDARHLVALVVALLVAVLLIISTISRVRRDVARDGARRVTRDAWRVAGLLAGIAAVMGAAVWPLVARWPLSLVSQRFSMAVATALVGAGAALLTIPNCRWRVGGAATLTIALAGAALVGDEHSLLRRTPSLRWTPRRLTTLSAMRVAGGGLTLTASPNGSAFAVSPYRPLRGESSDSGGRYVIGRFGDAMRTLRTNMAAKLVFIDDETVLVLDAAGNDSLELRCERVRTRADGTSDVLWRRRLVTIDEPQLILDRVHRTWLVFGRADGDYSFLIVTDTLGGTKPRLYELAGKSTADVGNIMTQPLAAFPQGGAIWSGMALYGNRQDVVAPLLLSMVGPVPWELRGTDAAGERFLADIEGTPSCGTELDARGVLCVEQRSSGSRLWRATSAKDVSPVADLPPLFDLVRAGASNRVAAAERFGSRAAVVDIDTRKAFRLTLPTAAAVGQTRHWTVDLAARGEYLLVLSRDRDGAIVTQFRIE